MKKTVLITLAILSFVFANAQNNGQTTKGKWLIEANTNFGAASASNTSIQFTSFSDNGGSTFNIGAEVGYFIMDDLSLKAGLGYGSVDKGGDSESFDSFSYKIGAKYYIIGVIPVQIDYNGASTDLNQDPSYFGVQGGYAFFLGDKVSIEPGLRYNFSLDDRFHKDAFQLNIGFVIHL
ncbi:hypothetical protein ATO12_01790 [Aquimarina atlantica]|uniref:Outer membrane protein beta-barrel domain-containing protein n=1 Tax=Aquimarina atlantica TaxID=1317122 RepID=A0A023C013_9FLAO|nr:hypothetical protein [Aquimarina atlantica]EZH75539.1 hypothetical protein ATO12_01790 [Aquimarina atlantica]